MYLGKKRGKIGREKASLSQLMDFIIVRGSAKRIIIILAVFLVLLCLPARAAWTGSLSGRVFKHSDNSLLEGVSVRLFQGVDENIADEHAWYWVGETQTDSIGYYQFTGLEQRRYRINIYSQNVLGTHYVETDLYNVQVFEGEETPNMNLYLRQAGLIYGFVKTTGGTPIPAAWVIAEAAWTEDGRNWHDTRTNQDGRYEFWVLPSPGKFYPVWVRSAMLPGTTYKVYGGDTYISGEAGYHPENHGYALLGTGTATKTFNDPSTYNYYIIVTYDGYVAKVDTVQGSDGFYYGTNTNGNASESWNVAGAPDGQFASVGYSGWDYQGGYILIDPPSGNTSLKVYIVPDGRGADPTYYESKWNGNFYKATASGTKVPDYKLELGGTVTGRVVNESGDGIKDAQIDGAWSKYGRFGDEVDTDSDGYFKLGCLPTGINYLSLDIGGREILQDNVKYMAGRAYRGPINITAGQTINLDEPFTIYKAGMVTGIVTDLNGLPIVDVEIEVSGRDIDGHDVWMEVVVTGASGQFTVDYVAPGTYFLRCRKDGNQMTVETDIRVTRGGHVNLDLVLRGAAEGATISGSITNYSDVAWHDSEGVQFPYYDEGGYHDFSIPSFGFLAFSMEHDYTKLDYLNINKNFVGFLNASDIDDGYGDYFEPNASETPGKYQLILPPGDIAVGMYIYQNYLPGEAGGATLHDFKRFNLTEGDSKVNVNFTAVTTNTGTLKGDISVPTSYDNFFREWCCIYAYALDADNNIKSAIPLGDAVAFAGWPPTKYEFRGLPAGNYMLRAYAWNLPIVVIPLVTVSDGTTIQNIDFTTNPADFCGEGSDQPDGYVDYWDLLYFAQRWHSSPSDTNWDPRCDLDKEDNYVDYWDLLVFAQQWHKGVKPYK